VEAHVGAVVRRADPTLPLCQARYIFPSPPTTRPLGRAIPSRAGSMAEADPPSGSPPGRSFAWP